jgi:hypothetical protein
VARPATRAGRQTQIAGLLLSALLGACAYQGEPPGGPPRTTPPGIQRTVPESGAVRPDLRGDAVIEFDEVIDEMPGSRGATGAITGLAQKIVLSPVGGNVKVSWHRTAIHIAPEEGWKPDRVYHLELFPGISDLHHNITKRGATVVFSTGPALPTAGLAGTALLWVEQRVLAQAVIRAAPVPDSLAYVTLADSAGNFQLPLIPSGRYRVWAIQDQNNNRHQDRREAFDTVTVTVDSSTQVLHRPFVHDTLGPRVRAVEPVDSVTLRVVFTAPVDPRRAPDTAAVGVFALPDTTRVPVRAWYPPARFDSIQARARALADSLKRLRDTTARRDTSARKGAPPPPQRPAVAGAAGTPGWRDTSAAKLDTARVRQLLSRRPVPYDRVIVQTAQVLTPGAKYLVRVRGATNLTGAAADGQGVLVVPIPKPVASDTTKSPKSPKSPAPPKPP